METRSSGRPGHYKFHRLIKAALTEPWRVHRNRTNTRDLTEFSPQLAGYLLLFDIAIFPGHQAHDHEGVVLFVAEANDR